MTGLRLWLLAGAGVAMAAGLAGAGLAQDNSPAAGGPPPAVPTSGAPAPVGTVPPSDVPPEEAAPVPPPRAVPTDETNTATADEAEPAAPEPPKPAEPLKRPRYMSAVLQALDKVTGKSLRFEARVNEPVRYGSLILAVHACETTAPDEDMSDSIAHLEVTSQPAPVGGRTAPPHQVYRGWMFASSPGLHPFTSPGYDLWLIACKTPSPAEPAAGAVVGSR